MSESTDPRYAELLGEVKASMGQDFMFKLDALVGERMAESQDEAPIGGLIEARFMSLRAEIADLRIHLATEVRTRRLVVVDAAGFEAVTAEAGARHAEVRVSCPADGDQDTSVFLGAATGDQERASAGVFLSGDGDVVGRFDAIRRVRSGFDARLYAHAPSGCASTMLDSEGLHTFGSDEASPGA